MHHQHEGTGGESQNIVLTELRTVKTTPGADRPSQNIIGQILASSTSDFFNSLSHKRTFDLDTDWLLTGGLDFLLSRYQVIDPSVSVSIAATKFLVSHSGRRGFITKLAHSGISSKVIMELAGHKHLGTTQRYIEVTDDMKRAAVEIVG